MIAWKVDSPDTSYFAKRYVPGAFDGFATHLVATGRSDRWLTDSHLAFARVTRQQVLSPIQGIGTIEPRENDSRVS